MTLQALKKDIEEKNNITFPIVFVYQDVPFIAQQYLDRISKNQQRAISYVDLNTQGGLFSAKKDDITVCFCDSLTLKNVDVDVVVTKNVSADVSCTVITLPKLNDLWVKDYLFSNLQGIDEKEIEWLFITCKKDVYRLYNEVQKLKTFDKKQKKSLFKLMVEEEQFSDLSNSTIFDFSNAIMKKDKTAVSGMLVKLSTIDCDPVALSSVLYQNFRKYIQVWLSKNPTEESTGLKSNVIYAIGKQPRVYSKDQLIKCFELLCGIDKMIKTGELETSFLIDYIVCKIFTV